MWQQFHLKVRYTYVSPRNPLCNADLCSHSKPLSPELSSCAVWAKIDLLCPDGGDWAFTQPTADPGSDRLLWKATLNCCSVRTPGHLEVSDKWPSTSLSPQTKVWGGIRALLVWEIRTNYVYLVHLDEAKFWTWMTVSVRMALLCTVINRTNTHMYFCIPIHLYLYIFMYQKAEFSTGLSRE